MTIKVDDQSQTLKVRVTKRFAIKNVDIETHKSFVDLAKKVNHGQADLLKLLVELGHKSLEKSS